MFLINKIINKIKKFKFNEDLKWEKSVTLFKNFVNNEMCNASGGTTTQMNNAIERLKILERR